ncbi:GH12552 [Drosophila grimshawi]|uniref:GH12552 n=1 Tax=Drosophila grimshawi TaxID=7222 RepID=B4JJW5_DROGR|nr:GH12552 [Drosophila grimshawi]
MAKRLRETDAKSIRKRSCRLRFKRLVRAVMLNQQWLDEPEEQGIVMNAKKNVAFLIRQKRKIGLLTVAEKALLRTPQENRTIDERKKLCMIISGLPCFSNIPPKLRARLIPVLRFSTIGGERVLIKEGDIPFFIYFMVSGEIEMKKSVHDKNTRKVSMVSEAIIGSGDWIGEVELLENCTRLNTLVALTPCEVLSINEDDFKRILQPFMKKQWHEKKLALKSSSYFDFLTDKQIVRACSYCVLTQYDPLQSIYAEDRGAVSCVHFILSGECVILQCLKMTVTKKDGKSTFELVKVENANQALFENTSKSIKSMGSSFIDHGLQKEKMLSDSVFNLNELLASSSDVEDEEALQMKKALGDDKSTEDDYFELLEEDYALDEDPMSKSSSARSSLTSVEAFSVSLERSSSKSAKQSVRIEIDDVQNDDVESDSVKIKSTDSSESHKAELNDSISFTETHFIDVGSLTYGGIFGLGEKMAHRVIMARTVVQCLLLPRYWLFEEEQNPGHVWQRRRFYLEGSIPSREELFGDFLKTRRWEKFKKDYVQSTLNPNSANSTQPEDIPIICRIVETRQDI